MRNGEFQASARMASPASRAASTSTTQCTSVTVTRDSSSTPTDTTASVRAAESCLRLLKHLPNYFVKINENFYLEGSKKPQQNIFPFHCNSTHLHRGGNCSEIFCNDNNDKPAKSSLNRAKIKCNFLQPQDLLYSVKEISKEIGNIFPCRLQAEAEEFIQVSHRLSS